MLEYVPNAGIRLVNVSSSDLGIYTVHVKVEVNGSEEEHVQEVILAEPESLPTNYTGVLDARLLPEAVLDESTGDWHAQISCGDFTDPEQTSLSVTWTLAILTARVEILEKDNSELRQENDNLRQQLKQSGSIYTIYPDPATPISVYCDQDTDGGGWTVIQRRQDGSVNFNRDWADYEAGFGNLTGEFWLGDSLMTGAGGDMDRVHNGQPFSTIDSDNDNSPTNCAAQTRSGWWFNHCAQANLNGQYGHAGDSGLVSATQEANIFESRPTADTLMKS
nr:hypothetical protein BaRGS_032480 [Batillaria attramentaria]